MSEVVVCNASPLIAFVQIGELELLHEVFESLSVPETILRANLGLGESQTIALGLELEAAQVVLDDLGARKLAERLDLPFIGTLGVLRAAKSAGLIAELKPHFDALRANKFHCSALVCRQILRSAGEGAS